MKKLSISSLRQPLVTKRRLHELCAEAVQQQVIRGEASHTQLRNRRRHLQKQVLKRIPAAGRLSPGQLIHAASMVLAMWGLLNVAVPNLAKAAGDAVFQPTILVNFNVGFNAAPTFADIDGDGDLDAFVGEKLGTVKFYRNTGSETAPIFTAETGPFPGVDVGDFAAPAFADIDGDGDLDAFVGEKLGTMKFYRNTGTAAVPRFAAEAGPLATIGVNGYAAPTFADIDGDGDLDALVGQAFGAVKFYRNTGSAAAPTFTAEAGPLAAVAVGNFAAPALADIDGDGDLDALVGEFGGTVQFYRNTGTETAPVFTSEASPLAGFDVGDFAAPAFADLDGDGDVDVLVGERLGTVQFYRNTGTAAAPLFTDPLGVFDVGFNAAPTLGDIDGDGDLDAFVGERYGRVRFYRNTGSTAAPIFTAETGPLAAFDVGSFATPALADIDGDGDLDVFVGERLGKVQFYRNTGSAAVPVFTAEAGPLATIDVGDSAAPAFADIDGDGDLDVFVGAVSGAVQFFRNTGSAATPLFTFETSPLAAFDVGNNSAPAFADIDGDGDLDALVGEKLGSVRFYRNTGSATAPIFTAEAGPLVGFNVSSYAAPVFADIDDDGDLDAWVGEFYGTTVLFQNVADVTAPVITLLGSAAVTIQSGSTYVDAGATAADIVDGDVTLNITTVNPVNTTIPGIYTVTYNVTDAALNAATQVTRMVTVSAVGAAGGGGGCTVQPNATFDDPVLPLMAMASLLWGWLRRKQL